MKKIMSCEMQGFEMFGEEQIAKRMHKNRITTTTIEYTQDM